MRYAQGPELRLLGTLTSLTMGENGSCPDGNAHNNTQNGGGAIGDPTGKNGCGQSG